MKDDKFIANRRSLLKALTAGSGATTVASTLPASWVKPLVESTVLPTHAQASICEPEPCEGNAVSGTENFNFTGGAQQFVVPQGVCSIDCEASGAGGGGGCSEIVIAGDGGDGELVMDNGILVCEGEILTVVVGGGGTGRWLRGHRWYWRLWWRTKWFWS